MPISDLIFYVLFKQIKAALFEQFLSYSPNCKKKERNYSALIYPLKAYTELKTVSTQNPVSCRCNCLFAEIIRILNLELNLFHHI